MLISVGIIGVGYVGNAIHQAFLESDNVDVSVFDKYKNGGMGSIEEVKEAEIIFLCLPTLYSEQIGGYNLEALHEVCHLLAESKFHGSVVIKSTVTPGISEMMAEQYDLNIIHNPEFLSVRTAVEDFINQKHIVLGRTKRVDVNTESFLRVKNLYNIHFPSATISVSTATETESMKIFANSFYAMKIQIFTEFYLLCKNQGSNFDRIVELMLKNGWINPMHTQVPGHDGQISYGGACFPKDTLALLKMMQKESIPCAVLSACISERNQMRKQNNS